MSIAMQEIVERNQIPAADVRRMTATIYESVLHNSDDITNGNFDAIHTADLERLFDEYDRLFFEGACGRLARLEGRELHFRLSRRMTSAGGKTTRYSYPAGNGSPGRTVFEIAVSTALLFQTFDDVERTITVSGIACKDRLEALQRVFEHELVHLAELLVWGKSSCRAARFASIASRFFGHTEMTHQLVTPRERALTQFGIRAGSRVRFRCDDAEYTGIVNRITKRATVLVESGDGTTYTDGKRYRKFYVPLRMLEEVE